MATADSGDSNLPNESGKEVCDIINCLAIYHIYYEISSISLIRRSEFFIDNFRAQVKRFHSTVA